MKSPVSVATKELTGSLNSLESTLTKNSGRWGVLWLTRNPKKDFYPEEHRDEGPASSLPKKPRSSLSPSTFRPLDVQTFRCLAAGTQRPHERALALTREAKQHTFRHRWNPSPSADEKQITCRGHRCWNDCDRGIAAGQRANCGAAGAGDGSAALA